MVVSKKNVYFDIDIENVISVTVITFFMLTVYYYEKKSGIPYRPNTNCI